MAVLELQRHDRPGRYDPPTRPYAPALSGVPVSPPDEHRCAVCGHHEYEHCHHYQLPLTPEAPRTERWAAPCPLFTPKAH